MRRKSSTWIVKTNSRRHSLRKKVEAENLELLKEKLAAARKERQLRLTKIIIVSGVVMAVLIFVGVMSALRAGDEQLSSSQAALLEKPGSGNVILMARDESGTLTHMLLISREETGGLSVYVIPARTVAEIEGQGFQRLDKALATGGQQRLDQAVADLFQVPVQYHITMTYQVLAGLVDQVGTVNFKTGIDLSLNKGPGEKGKVTIPAGENPTGSSLSLALLKAAAIDNKDGPRVAAVFYQGLHDALTIKPELDRKALARSLALRTQTDMPEDTFISFFMNFASAGPGFGVWPLPVKTVAEGSAAGAAEEWYFEPQIGELQVLMTGSPLDSQYQLEIRNGSEAKGVVESAAARLQQLRYSTSVSPEPSGVNFDVTQIRCGVDALGACNRVRDLLGHGTIIKDEYLEKKQIIVIIGRDI